MTPLTSYQSCRTTGGRALLALPSRFRPETAPHLRSISRPRGTPIDWKTRLLTATLMTIVMVALVTFIAPLLKLGFDRDFFRQWGKAYLVAWPIAAISRFLIMSTAQRLADRILLRH